MLGLGLALSIAKKTLGDAIDGLLSTLRGRATYYENGSASKSTIKAIDNADVLDKATILLTPTATSDARVHSVKTYTGDELVTNGTFDTDSDWTKGTGWSIGDGKATSIGSNYGQQLKQTILQTNKIYKLSFNIVDYTSGNIALESIYYGVTQTFNGIGSYVTYFTSLSQTELRLYSQNFIGSIDNVSVVDVSSDFDFDRASSATRINSSGLVQDMQSITDPELVLNGDFEELGDEEITNGSFDTDSDWTKSSQSTISNGTARILSTDGSFQFLKQSGYTSTQGKTVKITIDIVDVQSGQLKVFFDGGTNTENIPSTVGTHTVYLVNDGTVGTLAIARISGVTDITIDNVSVKQVDPNDRWSLQTGWSIEDGVATFDYDSSIQKIYTSNLVLNSGNNYKLSFEIKDVLSGTPSIFIANSGGSVGYNGNYVEYSEGTHTFIFSPASNQTTLAFFSRFSDFSIDNISLKDITFSEDVDLARINYDSNGENGHILLEPTSTNLITYSEDFSQTSFWNSNSDILTPVKSTTIAAPDGSYNAWHIVKDGTTAPKVASSVPGSASTEYTKSIWARTISGTGTAYFGEGYFSGDGVLTTVTTEWQRIEITVTQENFYAVDFRGSSTLTEVLIWGAQMEQLPYATSYIPSLSGSTVTRAAETLNGSGNSTLINSTEGVLYAEIAALADTDTTNPNRGLSISSGSTNNTIFIYFQSALNTLACILISNGTTQFSHSTSLFDVDNYLKIALKYKQDDFALWVNGVEVATDTIGNVPIGLNELAFDNGVGVDKFYGKCKALAVFNEALSDTELQNLTS